ncbi:MAG: nickel-dependent hydrogenase large subunit [Bauldia sp.]|uniref:hydrogenase large subunit n=1 Tax=Bauldia sp. TaxID=2575872 RepID=UPI001D784DB7|nr:nickel-dependent hydrogenase large subunit [Bauldia sp.]MCB1496930.1 nickel-dependent hydrogenase large subunit [Bauldia sp.]
MTVTQLQALIGAGKAVENHRPVPRAIVSESTWREAIGALAAERCSLLGLWATPGTVHMAVCEGSEIGVLSLDCADGHFPSVGARHPPAIRLERAIADLTGLEAAGAQDVRPWLDHGKWGVRRPLGDRIETDGPPPPYPFLTAEGAGLHQIPVGPVHAGVIEPGHFRFTANGETVVRLEERLGYAHKGIEALMAGADLERAAKLAGRVSGDSTVAYALAFARAVEAATDCDVPPRALYLRALMAELERIANHLGDIGAICNDAAFAIMLAHCAVLRERVLRFAADAFGHRLMMDRIVPGGVGTDLGAEDVTALRGLIKTIRRDFPRLVQLYDRTASLQDRTVGTGHLRPELARRFAPGGFVGRSAGRSFDARMTVAYPPYDALEFAVPTRAEGDVNARVWVRIEEVEQSLGIIEQILASLPAGDLIRDIPARGGEGLALVEGFRGEVLAWVRLSDDGTLAHCHLRDPSWFQWPLLEAVIEDNIVADFPLCNKSFNCSYSGHDL